MTEHLVTTAWDGQIQTVTLNRPAKRNAVSDRLLAALEAALLATPEGTRAIILNGAGEHFCAGLDLAEHQHRDPYGVMQASQAWHRIFQRIQFGGIPVIAALRGAVIGGGLELAAAAHIRVAEPDTLFQLPEGRHGIFVGGGASVRVARIIGAGRLCEMMLTGRVIAAEESLRLGLSHYLVDAGGALDKAHQLALRVAENAPLANWAMCSAIARIENMASEDGLFVESLTAALTHSGPDVAERIGGFLNRKGQGAQA
ncbi:crotonase/enoyl-CoA hydratase family protein [Denitromonas iodatirespirans]|uniref:Crotonase/enoyl-CoA hydratase family protein n=1 Tax=Denitromonas iodatirespirans TaxID=2795389 RepID=A0A944DFM2_DENI1|nr:crotonase/enoyl-CoA hydratase family protein [Denitromonas iodatirespirans]MBT0963478.1 crotonase/enoyl-CoA hydratase family protein [Denitromonas iodatirespirans]